MYNKLYKVTKCIELYKLGCPHFKQNQKITY